jgi:sugar-specific transcriptional regulator TrmB
MELNLHAITSTFGLSQSESEVFEHLLQYGSIKAVELRKNLHLDRAPFYRTLTSLESKNLIVISGALRKQTVGLQNIESISDSLRLKKLEIESAEKSLSSLAANMKELRDSRYHKDNVEIFSGPDAYLQSMQSILAGGGKILRDITPDSAMLYEMAGSKENYEGVVKKIKSERLRKNIAIKILFDNQAKNIDSLSATNPSALKESRVFRGDLKLDCYLNICGSRSLFYTKDATGSWGIVLKDPLIANLLSSLFEVIWNQSQNI